MGRYSVCVCGVSDEHGEVNPCVLLLRILISVYDRKFNPSPLCSKAVELFCSWACVPNDTLFRNISPGQK